MISVVQVKDVDKHYYLPDWIGREWYILLHKGDAVFDKDLNLNLDSGSIYNEWSKANGLDNQDLIEHQIAGIIVEGNFTTQKSIIGDNGAVFLIITGDCKAQSIVAGDSFIQIKGKADIEEAVYAFYNDGELHVDGKLTTVIYISNDHHSILSSHKAKFYFNSFDDDTRTNRISTSIKNSNIPSSLKKLLSPKVLVWEDILSALLKGQSILKKQDGNENTLEDWVSIVWNNPFAIRKVPQEVKSEEFYLTLFKEECPIDKMGICEIMGGIKPELVTYDVCVAVMQLSPKALLKAPMHFDLTELYEYCFERIPNQKDVFDEIPEAFRTKKMETFLKE